MTLTALKVGVLAPVAVLAAGTAQAAGEASTQASWAAPVGIVIFLVAFAVLLFALSRLIKPDPASQYRYWREGKDNPVIPFESDDGRD